jgi:hypothetical protein
MLRSKVWPDEPITCQHACASFALEHTPAQCMDLQCCSLRSPMRFLENAPLPKLVTMTSAASAKPTVKLPICLTTRRLRMILGHQLLSAQPGSASCASSVKVCKGPEGAAAGLWPSGYRTPARCNTQNGHTCALVHLAHPTRNTKSIHSFLQTFMQWCLATCRGS